MVYLISLQSDVLIPLVLAQFKDTNPFISRKYGIWFWLERRPRWCRVRFLCPFCGLQYEENCLYGKCDVACINLATGETVLVGDLEKCDKWQGCWKAEAHMGWLKACLFPACDNGGVKFMGLFSIRRNSSVAMSTFYHILLVFTEKIVTTIECYTKPDNCEPWTSEERKDKF